jgi:hypothetical protein
MKHPVRLAAVAALSLAGLATLVVPLLARSQVQVQAAPNFLPMGVASAGNASMAWFHEPSSGRVMACQASAGAGGAISAVQCTTAKLP